MPRKILAIASLALSAIHAQPASAKTVTLAPSSNWNVNYAEEKCQLVRAFGEGDERTVMYLKRYAPGDPFRLMLIGKYAKALKQTEEVTIQFGPGEAPFSTSARPGTAGDGKPALIFLGSMTIEPPEIDEHGYPSNKGEGTHSYLIGPDREAAVTEIAFLSGLRNEVHLETGSMAAPFAALRKCNEDLLTRWGIDIEKHRSLSRQVKPIGSPGDWIQASDYPAALRSFSGWVNFRLIVDTEGNVTDCGVQDTLEPEGFAQATCAILTRRAKFEPALDADGKPLKSYWVSAVRWESGY